MRTTAGSYALVNTVVPRDATVVAKLPSQGAIIIGKANLSEFAGYKGEVPSGWSVRGGQTQSAYVTGGSPGGSSSGSAVGLSAGFAAGAIGTETDGSILNPCEKAAAYGIKATVGLISRTGVVPVAMTADSLGPITRSTYDAALLLSAMAGKDDYDPASRSSIECTGSIRLIVTRVILFTAEVAPKTSFIDYTQFTKNRDHATFAGKRLGIPRDMMYHPCGGWK